MRVIGKTGRKDIALLYVAEMRPGKHVEFVESLQPPLPKKKKWVLIVSTLFGCPVGCAICDAGGWYQGPLTKEEIFSQIDYLISSSYPDKVVPVEKFKIQFARMGEPAFNPAVLAVLKEFPHRYQAPGFMPSLSTIAPQGSEDFFNQLLEIKDEHYSGGQFQLQFSIHSTDPLVRDRLIPVKKWDFAAIANFGEGFYRGGDRKITLNFALTDDSPLVPDVMCRYFDPRIFLIKITPVNPTVSAVEKGIKSGISVETAKDPELVKALRARGYDVVLSIGEPEENKIGSNCGQYIRKFLQGNHHISVPSYCYEMEPARAVHSPE